MQIISPQTPHWEETTANILRNGGIVIHPTDTAYGIAVDATNVDAVKKVYKLKQRGDKPLIVIVRDIKQAKEYVEWNDLATKFADKFWPGGLTLVLPKKDILPNAVSAGANTIGIRIPDSSITQSISRTFEKPYTSTSANISGKSTPYTIHDVLQQLPAGEIDLVIDVGDLPKQPTSTVVDISGKNPTILREGVIPSSELEKYL